MITFSEIRLNLENTWAIPMGDTMARIAPANEWESTLASRNQITTRLYGINRAITATRIMNAIKHLRAKMVFIPKNSRTDRRKNFAIIGFGIQKDLQFALSSHIELFGTKT